MQNLFPRIIVHIFFKPTIPLEPKKKEFAPNKCSIKEPGMAVSKLFNSGNYKMQRLLFRNSHIQKIKMYAS